MNPFFIILRPLFLAICLNLYFIMLRIILPESRAAVDRNNLGGAPDFEG